MKYDEEEEKPGAWLHTPFRSGSRRRWSAATLLRRTGEPGDVELGTRRVSSHRLIVDVCQERVPVQILRRRPLQRILCQTPENERLCLLRGACGEVRRRFLHGFVDVHQRLPRVRVLRPRRHPQVQRLRQRAAYAPDVGGRPGLRSVGRPHGCGGQGTDRLPQRSSVALVGKHLGGHPVRRPDKVDGRAVRRDVRVLETVPVRPQRVSKVGKLAEARRRDEDVLALDVSVEDAHLVQRLCAVQHLCDEARHLLLRQHRSALRPLPRTLRQRPTVDVLHEDRQPLPRKVREHLEVPDHVAVVDAPQDGQLGLRDAHVVFRRAFDGLQRHQLRAEALLRRHVLQPHERDGGVRAVPQHPLHLVAEHLPARHRRPPARARPAGHPDGRPGGERGALCLAEASMRRAVPERRRLHPRRHHRHHQLLVVVLRLRGRRRAHRARREDVHDTPVHRTHPPHPAERARVQRVVPGLVVHPVRVGEGTELREPPRLLRRQQRVLPWLGVGFEVVAAQRRRVQALLLHQVPQTLPTLRRHAQWRVRLRQRGRCAAAAAPACDLEACAALPVVRDVDVEGRDVAVLVAARDDRAAGGRLRSLERVAVSQAGVHEQRERGGRGGGGGHRRDGGSGLLVPAVDDDACFRVAGRDAEGEGLGDGVRCVASARRRRHTGVRGRQRQGNDGRRRSSRRRRRRVRHRRRHGRTALRPGEAAAAPTASSAALPHPRRLPLPLREGGVAALGRRQRGDFDQRGGCGCCGRAVVVSAAAAAAANTTTAAAAATTAAAAAPPQSRVPCADASLDSSAVSADSVPVTPVAATAAGTVAGGPVAMQVGWYQLPLDEKIAHAAHNLQKIVANPKQCTELQANLEQAHGLRVDCSSVFQKVEHHLQDFVVHPAGNYLVSKCFDYYTDLIQQAADLIGRNLKTYALHKHASYVIETMLTHQLTPIDTKKFLITEILAASNRVTIATHDSGNFVIQRAIECCPEDLLPMMVDSVQAVSLLTPHGAKMLKKVQARLSRSNNSALLAKFGGSNSKRTQERRHGAQPAPHQQPQHHQQPPQHQHQQQQKQQHPPMQYGQAAPGCPTDVANPPMGQGHMASHYPPVHPSQQSFQQSNQQPHVPGAHHLPPSQHLPPATETFCDPYDPGYQGQYYEYPQQQQQQQQPPQQQTRNAPYNTGYQQEQVHKHAPYALSNADSSYSTGQPSTPPTLDDMNACDNGYMQAQWADCHLEMQH
eukprot:Rhum_TRINITY_DN15307_c7_g1::Rhum_TRINITY_DN15307_c7_g1_i1::g.151916::m.151916